MTDEWRERAACQGIDQALFYPQRNNAAEYERGKQFCRVCPVRAECLNEGLMESEGLWGGMDPGERRRYRKRNNISLIPVRQCGTLSGYTGGCRCEPCRFAKHLYSLRRGGGVA